MLNSISLRDSWSPKDSGNQLKKDDSIILLLNNSGIEFETCSNGKNNLSEFNTGFGIGSNLHFKTKCKVPELKTPLYLENYFSEFKTEEEKAAARHALGLYNKGDVVAMSLLTTKEALPSSLELSQPIVKLMHQGDKFFAPVTTFNAVYDLKGKTLTKHLNEIQSLITTLQLEILKINLISKETKISSLGDVKLFLQGFNNGEVLKDTLDEMDQEMIRFEKTGLIISND